MGKKAIVDTNVFISSFLASTTVNAALSALIQTHEIYMPKQQLAEIRRVLSYKKLGFTNKQQKQFLKYIDQVVHIISVDTIRPRLQDPDDDIYIQAALDYNIDIILTGDTDILVYKHPSITAIMPTDFLKKQ